jgi:hypothetical protein
MKDNFMKNKESFVDDDEPESNSSKIYDNKITPTKKTISEEKKKEKEEVEEEEEDKKTNIEDRKLFRTKSIKKEDSTLNKREKNEIMDQVRKSFQRDFSILKNNVLDELDKGKKLIQNDLTYEKLFEIQEIHVSSKDGVISNEAQEKKKMKEILSEKEDDIKETFIDGISDDDEEGMYDGITSPYCFNCSEL